MTAPNNMLCSFCSRSSRQVKKLIAGPNVYICDGCVELCMDALRDTVSIPKSQKPSSPPPVENSDGAIHRPREIKEFLDRYIIGQDQAKTVISVAVYDHYKRLSNPTVDGVEIQKSNVLLIGPTGSGKTLIAETIARLLDVPFTIADATSITEAGYVGDDAEMIISRLLQAAGGDVKKAERGIVYIDEIDKKATKAPGTHARDVSGEGAQQALLKILEGAELMVPANGKKGPAAELVKINTKNILFVCGGAFVGLDKVISSGLDSGAGIGFVAERVGRKVRSNNEVMRHLAAEHLVKYGLIPELVGRLPMHVVLDEIDEAALVDILTKPENALTKQLGALFGLDGVKLTFEDSVLTSVAKEAIKRGTGARGLRGVLNSVLLNVRFDLPDLRDKGATEVVLTSIDPAIPPQIVYGNQAAVI